MRISFASQRSTPDELVEIGCYLLSGLTFKGSRTLDEYRVGIIARKCLIAGSGAITVAKMCGNLRQAVSRSETYPSYHADLLGVLLEVQPLATLESLCGGGEAELRLGLSILEQNSRLRPNSLDMIPEDHLVSWCDEMPRIRYPAVAAAVTAFQPSTETGKPQLTSVGRKLVDNAPDRVGVLRNLVRQLAPADLLGVLDQVATDEDRSVVEFVAEEKIRVAQIVQAQRQAEAWVAKQRDVNSDERFE
jgi:hypothetical protein